MEMNRDWSDVEKAISDFNKQLNEKVFKFKIQMETYKLKDNCFTASPQIFGQYKGQAHTKGQWTKIFPILLLDSGGFFNNNFEKVNPPIDSKWVPPSDVILIDEYDPAECYYQLSAIILIENKNVRKFLGEVKTMIQWKECLQGTEGYGYYRFEDFKRELKYVHHAYLKEKKKSGNFYAFPDGYLLFYNSIEEVWDKVRRFDKIKKVFGSDTNIIEKQEKIESIIYQ